jgi:hypothetical protein
VTFPFFRELLANAMPKDNFGFSSNLAVQKIGLRETTPWVKPEALGVPE